MLMTQAMQLDWYTCRWLIEEYHKCLKTGCALEKRQLEQATSLVTLLGFFALCGCAIATATFS